MAQGHPSPEAFREIIAAGIQAPSADNRHELSFDQFGQSIRVWSECGASTQAFHRRILFMFGLGAVVENMVLRAASFDLAAEVRWFPDGAVPDMAASVDLSAARSVKGAELASAIAGRHTNRKFFRGPALSTPQQRMLEQDAAAIDSVRLVWMDEARLRKQALSLIRLAESERFRCESLHRDLFSCIRFEVGWDGVAEEGLSPGSLEVERPLRGAFQALRHWPLMRTFSRFGVHRLLGLRAGDAPCRFSPHLGVVATTLPLECGARAAGRAFERVWLRATLLGLAVQPLAASALLCLRQYEDVRPALRKELAHGWARLIPGMTPLMVFRLGRSSQATLRSGRRPLASYLRQAP